MPRYGGSYVPEDVRWHCLTRDHHQVWLYRPPAPGGKYRKRILIGEVRRSATVGYKTRHWRAFPAGVTEFPEVFDNHVKALQHLKDVWEARSVIQHVSPPKHASPARPEAWVEFLGADPWAQAS